MDRFDPHPLFSQTHSFGNNYFSNPLMQILLSMYTGSHGMPRPLSGQSIHESFLNRDRSRHFFELQRSGFVNNMLFQKMGIADSQATSIASMFMSSPESAANKLLTPMLGGNPVAASMQLYAGLSGANVMGNFGRMRNVSSGETMEMMNKLASSFYQSEKYAPATHTTSDDLISRSKELASKVHKELAPEVKKIADSDVQDKKNKILELYKAKGIHLNPEFIDDEGKLLPAADSQIANYNVTTGAGTYEEIATRESRELKQREASEKKIDLTKIKELIKSQGDELNEEISDKIEKQLKDAYGVATEELKSSQPRKTGLDKTKVAQRLDELEASAKAQAEKTTPFEDLQNNQALSPEELQTKTTEKVGTLRGELAGRASAVVASDSADKKNEVLKLYKDVGIHLNPEHVNADGTLSTKAEEQLRNYNIALDSDTFEAKETKIASAARRTALENTQTKIKNVKTLLTPTSTSPELPLEDSEKIAKQLEENFGVNTEDLKSDSPGKPLLDKTKVEKKLNELATQATSEAQQTTPFDKIQKTVLERDILNKAASQKVRLMREELAARAAEVVGDSDENKKQRVLDVYKDQGVYLNPEHVNQDGTLQPEAYAQLSNYRVASGSGTYEERATREARHAKIAAAGTLKFKFNKVQKQIAFSPEELNVEQSQEIEEQLKDTPGLDVEKLKVTNPQGQNVLSKSKVIQELKQLSLKSTEEAQKLAPFDKYQLPGSVREASNKRSTELVVSMREELAARAAEVVGDSGENKKQRVLDVYKDQGVYLNPEHINEDGTLKDKAKEQLSNYRVAVGSGTYEERATREARLTRRLNMPQMQQTLNELGDVQNQLAAVPGELDTEVSSSIAAKIQDITGTTVEDLQTKNSKGQTVLDKTKVTEKLQNLSLDVSRKMNSTTLFEDLQKPTTTRDKLNEESIQLAASMRRELAKSATQIVKDQQTAKKARVVELFKTKGIHLNPEYVNEDGTLKDEAEEQLSNYRVAAGSNTYEEHAVRGEKSKRLAIARSNKEELDKMLQSVNQAAKVIAPVEAVRIENLLKTKYNVDVADLKTKTEDGRSEVFDKAKLRKKLEDLTATTVSEANKSNPFEDIHDKSVQFQRADGRITGFNLEATRGFQLQDFTSGFVAAADMRLLGNARNLSPAQSLAKFTQNAGGALSAARDVFGNASGGQLVQKISDLLGTSAQDLSNSNPEGGASQVEALLRKVSATSRVAGMSIKAMLSIIDTSKELLAQNPQLQYANSAAVARTATDAVITATSMAANMSAEEYRSAGGQTGLVASTIKEGHAFAQSPLGVGLSALMSYAQARGGEEGKNTFDFLQKQLKEGNYTADFLQTQGGVSKIADMLGISTSEVSKIMDNQVLGQKGLKNEKIAELILGTKGQDQLAIAALNNDINNPLIGGSLEKLEENFKDYVRKTPGGNADKFFTQLLSSAPSGGMVQQGYIMAEQSIKRRLRDSLLPQEERDALQKEVEQQAERDSEMAKKFDRIRANPITQLTDALMRGQSLTGYNIEQAATGISQIIATPEPQLNDEQQRILTAAQVEFKKSADIFKKNNNRNFSSLDSQSQRQIIASINALTNLRKIDLPKGEAEKLSDYTEEDITETIKTLKSKNLSSKEEAASFIKETEDLINTAGNREKLESDLSKTDPTRLKQYDILKKFETTFGLESVNQLIRGDTSGLLGSQLASLQTQAKLKSLDQYTEESKDSFLKNLTSRAKGEGEEANQLKKFLDQETKDGIDGLLKAIENPDKREQLEVQFPSVMNKVIDFKKSLDDAREQILSAPANDPVNKAQQQQEDLIKQLVTLNQALTGQNNISDAFNLLAGALGNFY